MRRAFFWREDRRRQLEVALRSWIGTPFVGKTRRRGVGVDCVNLAAAIYMECGVIDDFQPPEYNLDHSNHSDVELVIAYVEETKRFQMVNGPELQALVMPGDLLCFNWARSAHHVGVALTGKLFVHVYARHVVMESPLLDRHWKKGLARVYRPVEETIVQPLDVRGGSETVGASVGLRNVEAM